MGLTGEFPAQITNVQLKQTYKNTRENTRKLGKFACKTLHTDYNLHMFGLLEFLHC